MKDKNESTLTVTIRGKGAENLARAARVLNMDPGYFIGAYYGEDDILSKPGEFATVVVDQFVFSDEEIREIAQNVKTEFGVKAYAIPREESLDYTGLSGTQMVVHVEQESEEDTQEPRPVRDDIVVKLTGTEAAKCRAAAERAGEDPEDWARRWILAGLECDQTVGN